MKTKQTKMAIGLRVLPPVHDFYKNMFESPAAGAEFAMEAFRVLVRRSLTELKGKLTHEELGVIVNIAAHISLSSKQFGEHILSDVSDIINLEQPFDRWEVDGRAYLGKLKGLTTLQLGALALWARAYWIQEVREDENPQGKAMSMDHYVSLLADSGDY